MSTARIDGLAALQSGDTQTAIARLEAAVQEDPSDYDACLYLGGAYGQAGRPMDAIKSVTQAVQLQPSNAQARYNLGVAMEQGGYNEQALQVYNQALHLQPDYPNAQQAVARLQASSNQGFGAPAGSSTSTRVSGQQFGQEQPNPSQQPALQPTQYAQPAAFGQQAQQPTAYNPLAPTSEPQPTAYNPLAPPPQSAQTTQQFTPPGLQQPGAFGRPNPPAIQPQQPVEAGLGSYMAPPPPAARPAPGGYGAPAAYGAGPSAYSSVPAYDDEFKLGQAFKDFFRALFTPKVLLSEMAGCDSSRSAWALFTVYGIIMIAVYGILGLIIGAKVGAAVLGLLAAVLYAAIGIVGLLIIWALFALIVHMMSRAFGSSLRYGASIRCVIIGNAPSVMLGLVSMLCIGVIASSAIGLTKSTLDMINEIVSSANQNSHLQGNPGVKHTNSSKPAKSKQSTPYSVASSGGSNSSPFGGSTSPGSNPSGAGTSGPNPFGAGAPGSMAGGEIGPVAVRSMQQMLGAYLMLILVGLVSGLWSAILLGAAVSNIHEISGGAAAGVVILSWLISVAIIVVLYIIFFGAILAAVMASAPH